MKVFPKTRWSKTRPNETTPSILTKERVNFHHSSTKPCTSQQKKTWDHLETQKKTPDDVFCARQTSSLFCGSLQFAGTWFLKIYNNSSASARNFIQCGTEYLARIEVAYGKNPPKNARFLLNHRGWSKKRWSNTETVTSWNNHSYKTLSSVGSFCHVLNHISVTETLKKATRVNSRQKHSKNSDQSQQFALLKWYPFITNFLKRTPNNHPGTRGSSPTFHQHYPTQHNLLSLAPDYTMFWSPKTTLFGSP